MGLPFSSARLKIKRAEDHIKELYAFVESFASAPDLHSIDIEYDTRNTDGELVVSIHKSKEELRDEAALIIGDVYHNLRSALDILWFEIVSPTGLETKWTRFPILDTSEELIGKLNPALKNGQITKAVHEFVRDTIKPYRDGNFMLWSVEEANIIDKHQLLIPNFSVIAIHGARIQNDQEIIEVPPLFTDSSFRRRPSQLSLRSFGKNPKVIDKGQTALGYGFSLGHPQEGDPVILTLNTVTKEIARTIEAFAILLG